MNVAAHTIVIINFLRMRYTQFNSKWLDIKHLANFKLLFLRMVFILVLENITHAEVNVFALHATQLLVQLVNCDWQMLTFQMRAEWRSA